MLVRTNYVIEQFHSFSKRMFDIIMQLTFQKEFARFALQIGEFYPAWGIFTDEVRTHIKLQIKA